MAIRSAQPDPAVNWLRGNPWIILSALAVGIFALVRYGLDGYMVRTEWMAEPLYNPFTKDWTAINGQLVEIPGYTYALVTRTVTIAPQLTVWPALIYGVGVLLCFSLMVACLSYLPKLGTADSIRFWLAATLIVAASAFLVSDGPVNLPEAGTMLRGASIAVNAGLFYVFNQIWGRRPLWLRFGLIALGNLGWFASLYFLGDGWPAYTLWAGYSTPVLLILSCLFAFQAAYFLPYGALLLAVRQNINGVLAYLLIIFFLAGNIYLSYQESRGLGVEGLYTPDAFWILAALAVFGFPAYYRFVSEDSNWFPLAPLARPLYAAWAGLTFCFVTWAVGTENGPLVEVVEDATNLSLLGVTAGFVVYVLANFAAPLWSSHRIDRVLFAPYRLPFGGIMAVAATIIYLMYAAAGSFQFYQAQAGGTNAVADGYFLKQDYQAADLFYQEALVGDNYNFHSNYMLAQLARSRGSEADAERYLRQSVFSKPRPEAYVELAERYRSTAFIRQIEILTEGRKRFPDSDLLANNLLEAYLGSDLTDSITALAAQLTGSESADIRTNVLAASALGKLTNNIELPSDGPLANRYLGQRPRPDACDGLKSVIDTACSILRQVSLMSSMGPSSARNLFLHPPGWTTSSANLKPATTRTFSTPEPGCSGTPANACKPWRTCLPWPGARA